MKFIRVNENEIRCVLTHEELVQFGIEIDDIVAKNMKTRRFFQALLEQAGKALGMTGPKQIRITSAQINVLEDKSISILFREEKKELPVELRREILNVMEEQLKLGGNDTEEAMSELRRLREELNAEEDDRDYSRESFLVQFDSIEDAVNYARECSFSGQVISRFYKDLRDDSYFLIVLRHVLTDEVFRRLRMTAEEFGRVPELSLAARAYFIENSECLIEENAFAELSALNS
ncbi:MAG: adaptor protein MecA [Lachnospiraceae bacterium]|nr:adaptor protein MecA [Lachnospiraceae bacterium]